MAIEIRNFPFVNPVIVGGSKDVLSYKVALVVSHDCLQIKTKACVCCDIRLLSLAYVLPSVPISIQLILMLGN